jgi:methylaspartate ammonia-lyase
VDQKLNALKKRYEAQIAESLATLNIYINNPVGIGEHPQHLNEMDKLLQVIVDAEEKTKMIERYVK